MKLLRDYLRLADIGDPAAFVAKHPWPVLLYVAPAHDVPRDFTVSDSIARTRDVPIRRPLPFDPDTTHVLAVQKSERNPETRITLGRGLHNDLVINHGGISKSQASFEYLAGEGWFLTDVGSRNGTAVGLEVLAPNQPARLSGRCDISFGSCKLTFFEARELGRLLTELQSWLRS